MKITACSIVKNEEKNIARSIESYRSAVDEVIIVDTGSTDRTVEICEHLGAKVLHYKWDNDFSAAKNLALEEATGDWIIFLDADEWFEPKLNSQQLVNALNTVDKHPGIDLLKVKFFNIEESTGKVVSSTVISRLFRNSPEIRFEGKIHEEIKKKGKDMGIALLDKLKIYHSGYSKDRIMNKCRRNIEMLIHALKTGDPNPKLCFYLCRENAAIGNNEEALRYGNIFLAQQNVENQIKEANVLVSIYEYNIMLKMKLNSKFTMKDIEEAIRLGIEKYPELPVHYYLQGGYFRKIDEDKALESYETALQKQKNYHLDYINNFDSHLYDAYYQLSLIYADRHNFEDALSYSMLSLLENPFYDKAFEQLMELIQRRSTPEILLILKRIYDFSDETHIKFVAHQLMGYSCKEVFIYFAKRYNQEFNGQDETTYLAMLLSGYITETVDLAMQAYYNAGREDDRYYATLGILYGKRKDLFEKYKMNLNKDYAMIVNRYLYVEEITSATEDELRAWIHLYEKVYWLVDKEAREAFEDLFPEYPSDIIKAVMKYIMMTKDYNQIVNTAEKLKAKNKDVKINFQLDKMKMAAHYYMEEYEQCLGEIEQLLLNKEMDLDFKIITYLNGISKSNTISLVRNKAARLYKEYQALFYQITVDMSFIACNKVAEIPRKHSEIDYTILSVDRFKELLNEKKGEIPLFILDILFEEVKYLSSIEENEKVADLLIILISHDYKKDMMYFKLAQVLNKMKQIELAIYSYEQAFTENVALAEKLCIDEYNPNKNYIYKKALSTKNQKTCPICGKSTELAGAYSMVGNSGFNENMPAIKKWRYCLHCKHQFVENMPAVSPERLMDKKALNDLIREAEKELTLYEDYAEKIHGYKKSGKWLDSSSSINSMLLAASQYDYELSGIVESSLIAEVVSKKWNVELEVKKLSDFVESEKYDVITLTNNLEENESCQETLSKVYQLLNEDGIVGIITPALNSAYAKISGCHNKVYKEQYVCQYFSKHSLTKLIEASGFEVIDYQIKNGVMLLIAKK